MVSPEDSAADVDRFAGLIRAEPLPLGEAALVVAAVLGDPGTVAAGEARLAELAGDVRGRDLEAVSRHLFGTLGFRGDSGSYYDPANSMLSSVLTRRRGIPITLAIVTVEVARRLGVEATVVGMPGHVLVGDGDPPTRWIDAFHGGQWLDAAGARARFATIHGRHAAFDPSYLRAIPDVHVLARLLANLVGIYAASGDGHRLLKVRQLRATIAEVGEHERTQLAEAFAAVGRFEEAAELWEREQAVRSGPLAEAAAAEVERLRANLN